MSSKICSITISRMFTCIMWHVSLTCKRQVSQLIVDGHRDGVSGVLLADGTRINASAILSNATPSVTFLKLTPANVLPEDFLNAAKGLDYRSVLNIDTIAVWFFTFCTSTVRYSSCTLWSRFAKYKFALLLSIPRSWPPLVEFLHLPPKSCVHSSSSVLLPSKPPIAFGACHCLVVKYMLSGFPFARIEFLGAPPSMKIPGCWALLPIFSTGFGAQYCTADHTAFCQSLALHPMQLLEG
eukprot:Gb_31412 [translate_table: standard]